MVALRTALVSLLTLCVSSSALALDLENRPSPRNEARPRRNRTDFIVLHTTEGAAKGALGKLRKNGEAHYLVTRNGTVFRIVDKDRVAYHAGRSMWGGHQDLDQVSVGIEVVGYHDRALPKAQLTALAELVRQLRALYDVPAERVLTHAQVAYGQPNRYHRYKHRGRKRCAMNLASAEVRAALGLDAAPARDPDVDAGRLRVADRTLFARLFPKVRLTGSGRSKASPMEVALAKLTAAPADAPAPEPEKAKPEAVVAKAEAAVPKAPAKAKIEVVAKAAPVKAEAPRLAVAPAPTKKPARAPRARGLCAVNTQRGHAQAVAGAGYAAESTIYMLPDGRVRTGAQLARRQAGLLSDLPSGTRVLTDKRFGGYVKPGRAPSEICGATKWRSPDTVYRLPSGELVAGPKVDPARLPRATMVFCAP